MSMTASPQTRSFKRQLFSLVQQPWFAIACVLTLATGLYLYQLGTESVWFDERLSIQGVENGTQLPPNNLVRPVYYILLWGWMQFGQGVVWLRSLSVILGLGSIFLLYRLGCRVADKPVGLIAALLLTLSPLFINHAQEIRMYTLIVFLSLAGTLGLAKALEQPTFMTINSWAIARFILLLTSPATIVLLVPDVLLIGWQFWHQRRYIMAFGIRLLLMGGFLLPFALSVTRAVNDFSSDWAVPYPKPNIVLIVSEVIHLTVFWPLRHLLDTGISANELMQQVNQEPLGSWLVDHLLGSNLSSLAFYGGVALLLLLVLGVSILNRTYSPQVMWAKAWAILPALAILTFSFVFTSIWRARYLLFFSPYFLLLLAVGWMVIWRWQPKVAIALFLIYGAAVSGGLYHYYTTLYRTLGGSPT